MVVQLLPILRSRKISNSESHLFTRSHVQKGTFAKIHHSRLGRSAFVFSSFLLVLLALTLPSMALDMDTDPMDAQWINPIPSVSISPSSPADTTIATWGTPVTGSTSKSGYTFVVNSSLNEIVSGTQFLIGTFTHENWPVTGDTLDSITLKVLLHFADSDIGSNGTVTLTIPFDHDETPNSPSGTYYCTTCPDNSCITLTGCAYNVPENSTCYGCADRVKITTTSVEIDFGDESCDLEVELGSSTTFYTEERKSNTIQLYGYFSCPVADLELEKSVDDATPDVGTDVTFTLVAGNHGPSDASGVTVKDVLPSGLDYVSHSGGTYSETTGIWTIGDLDVGDTDTLTITATVLVSGDYDNYAQVWTADQGDPDSDPGDNSTSDDDDDRVDLNPVPVADLSPTCRSPRSPMTPPPTSATT